MICIMIRSKNKSESWIIMFYNCKITLDRSELFLCKLIKPRIVLLRATCIGFIKSISHYRNTLRHSKVIELFLLALILKRNSKVFLCLEMITYLGIMNLLCFYRILGAKKGIFNELKARLLNIMFILDCLISFFDEWKYRLDTFPRCSKQIFPYFLLFWLVCPL